ncbi:hypothetical protein [Taibaiella chishuiensis]|uniref:Uncharacterized protein n=1 Tax=Taibaiella chishuiensis TaxID=1434707 RepID=A0A2P8CY23_9BACT|nr:hypothetical protein [Taibaiella chishuiensis]PSK89870.1 hypothetical protein B0I18_110171 [Taibaiella chishuiensis]
MRFLLPTAIVVLFMASCTATTETSYSDVQVDSIAKAKLDSINLMLKRRNDSLINAAAIQEARRLDSLDKGKAVPVKIVPVIPDKLPRREYENMPSLPPARKDTGR